MFKVGDIVRCIDDSSSLELKKGATYQVYSIHNDIGCIAVIDDPHAFHWMENRFELVSMGNGDPATHGFYGIPPTTLPPSLPTGQSLGQSQQPDWSAALRGANSNTRPVELPQPAIKREWTTKCTCGTASVRGSKHSDWCDIK